MKRFSVFVFLLVLLLVGCSDSKLNTIKNGIDIGYVKNDTELSVKNNFFVPLKVEGYDVTWTSQSPNLEFSNEKALVTRGNIDVIAHFKASFVYNQKTYEVDFEVTIIKADEIIDSFDFLPIVEKIVIPRSTSSDIELPTLIDGVTITWTSSNPQVISNEGVVNRQPSDTEVRLTATLTKDLESKVITFDVVVEKEPSIDYQAILNKITLPSSTDKNISLPKVVDNVLVTWFSNHENMTNEGVITQTSEDITVQLTATLGDVEKVFEITILKKTEGIISTKTPIADVRALSEGTVVTVHGVVTSLMTNGNFTIEDSTGAIPVYFGSNNNALEVGRVYIIEGELSIFNGLKQIGTSKKAPIIKETLDKVPLPSVIDLSDYSLDYDDVTLYEGHVISYQNLEVTQVLTPNNALEFMVKNEAGETTNARLDKRVNDQPYAFLGIKVGDIIDLYNVTVGQYNEKAQFLFTRRSSIESRDKDPEKITFYGVSNQIYTIGDSEPNYLEGITAKNGHGVDFTDFLEVNHSLVNLNEVGVYEVTITLSTDNTVSTSYQLTVRDKATPGNYSGYYQSLSGLTGQALNNELQRLIRNTGRATGSTSEVKQVDRWNGSYYKIYTGMGPYGNREHTWPSSLLGSTKDDLHNLRAANERVNSSRSNYPFTDSNKPFTGSQPYEKIGNAWYPGDEHIGDVARIVLYISIRYNLPLSRVGNLNLFLKWHQLDPVNEFEQTRNDRIYNIQSNRNPFIDHPELVELYFGSATSFSVPISLIEASLQLHTYYQTHL